jgi:hypothetical protein
MIDTEKDLHTIPIDNIINIANSSRYPYFNASNARYFKAKQFPIAYRYKTVGFFIESTKPDNESPRAYSVRGFNFVDVDCFDVSKSGEFATLGQAKRFLRLVLNSGLLDHFYWHVHYVSQVHKLEGRERARKVLAS